MPGLATDRRVSRDQLHVRHSQQPAVDGEKQRQCVCIRSTGVNASAVSHDGTSLRLLRRGEEIIVEVGATLFLLPGLYPMRLQANSPVLACEQERERNADATGAVADVTPLEDSKPVGKQASSLDPGGTAEAAAVVASADIEWDAAHAAWAELEQSIEQEAEGAPDRATTASGHDGGAVASPAAAPSTKNKVPVTAKAVVGSTSDANTDQQQNKRARQLKQQRQATTPAPSSKRAHSDRSDDENNSSAESSMSDSDSDFDAGRGSDDEYQDTVSPGVVVGNKRKRRSIRNISSGSAGRKTATAPATASNIDDSGKSSDGGRAVWEWDGGRSGWKPYSEKHHDLVEAAYQAWRAKSLDDDEHASDADDTIELDNGYIVVFGGGRATARQVKADDPTRSRKVQRRVVH